MDKCPFCLRHPIQLASLVDRPCIHLSPALDVHGTGGRGLPHSPQHKTLVSNFCQIKSEIKVWANVEIQQHSRNRQESYYYYFLEGSFLTFFEKFYLSFFPLSSLKRKSQQKMYYLLDSFIRKSSKSPLTNKYFQVNGIYSSVEILYFSSVHIFSFKKRYRFF